MRLLTLSALILVLNCAGIAYAVEPTKPAAPRTIDMTTVITDMHGKPIPDLGQATPADPKCDKCGPLTLGTVVASALLADKPTAMGQPGMSAIDKAKHGVLAVRLLDDKAAVLTAAEASDIVSLLNVWSPIVVMRAVPLIDPNIDLSGK